MMNRKLLMMAGISTLFTGPVLAQMTTPAPTTTPSTTSPATQAPPGAATTATPATPTAAKVTTGATVADTKGGSVGTIESVDGEFAVLATGTNKVRLPVASFAQGTSGLVIAMTKAEVDAAASGAAASNSADAKAQIVAGASVTDTKGGSVGTIEAVEGEFATVKTANSTVKLPMTAFGKGASGPVIAMTAAELDAAAKSATAPSGGQ